MGKARRYAGRAMPFPRRLLTEDEEVVVELRPHWAFLGRPLVVAVAVVVLAIAVAVNFPNASVVVLYVLLALVTGSALWLAGRLVRWFASSFVVTNTRIIQRTGVLSRRGLELRLERVNQLSYHQSIPDRILRTGELQVEMGGDTGLLVFDHVPRPAAVQSVITEQIDALRHRAGVPSSHGSGHASWQAVARADATNPLGAPGRAGPEPGITGDTPPSGTARVHAIAIRRGHGGGATRAARRAATAGDRHRRGVRLQEGRAARPSLTRAADRCRGRRSASRAAGRCRSRTVEEVGAAGGHDPPRRGAQGAEIECAGLGEGHHATAEPGSGQPGPVDARSCLEPLHQRRRAPESTPRSPGPGCGGSRT